MQRAKDERLLIIQADDFGMTKGINRGIIEAFEAGAVTNTTLLVTMAHTEEAVQLAKQHPHLPVGLHLSLTNGYPVSEPGDVSTLVDAAGKLLRRPERVYPVADPQHVVRELRAQLGRFLAFGLHPSHIDTHHTIIEHPVVRDTVFQMAYDLSVPIRSLGKEEVKLAARQRGIPVPDWYRDAYFEEPRPPFPVTPTRLQSIVRETKPGVTDLGCHIGYVDEELPLHTTYVEGRDRELQSFLEAEVKAEIESEHVRLVSFNDLKTLQSAS